MEQLPYIDEHDIQIDATRDQVWAALVPLLSRQFGGPPAPVSRVLRLRPAELRGDWCGTPHPGDALPGFEVAESKAPARLALRGGHRFSRYALVFELDPADAGCTLRAKTWAAFPGLTGRGYRALVIGTGGHRLVVRRLLRDVARGVSST